jgi:hypothetical protein
MGGKVLGGCAGEPDLLRAVPVMDHWMVLLHSFHVSIPVLMRLYQGLPIVSQGLEDAPDAPPLQALHQEDSLVLVFAILELEHAFDFGNAGSDPDYDKVQPSIVVFNEFDVSF